MTAFDDLDDYLALPRATSLVMSPDGTRLVLAQSVLDEKATALGVFSTFQAYNYVSLFTERDPSFPMLLLLNVTYWYAWALLVPGSLSIISATFAGEPVRFRKGGTGRWVLGKDDPAIDLDWGEPGLSPAERVIGWNSLEVLSLAQASGGAAVAKFPRSRHRNT